MKPLHHKKHTLAKRGLSLLCILALCLGLLPVTALAAREDAPNDLYVGTTNIGSSSYNDNAAYWTSSDGGTNWTHQENQPEGDRYIYYNGQGTLELHNVTIQGADNTGSPPYGAGIYALCGTNQSVSLTIQLTGHNTITGDFGIYVEAQQGGTLGTNAFLLIQNSSDDGSLEVSGSSHGIYVKSGTGDASLTIENASVDAKSTPSSTYVNYAGVCVGSSAAATAPALSLAVNGGSLTTSGTESNGGIQFYVGAYGVTSATTSLTVSDNAIVDARNGGISASGVSGNPNVTIGSTDSTGGIVFDGSAGTVYGDVTLQDNLTINEGETLTIGKDASLTVPENKTLTNDGTIDNGGTLTNSGTVTNNGTINVEDGGKLEGTPTGGTVVNAPAITAQPESQTVTEGQSASFTVAASGDSLTYKWQQSTDNGQSWTDIDGATNATYTAEATSTDMSGTQYRCMVSNSAGSVTSNAVTLTVDPVSVAGVTLNKTELALFTGESETLTATVAPETATDKNVTWSSDKPEVATVDNGKVTAVGAGTATITVTTQDGKKTATCTVTVTDKTYTISADATVLNFGSAYTGYAQPAAKIVTVKNTGNQPVTLTQPTAANYVIGKLSPTTLEPNATATFTVQPKAGLAAGSYEENLTISGTGGTSASVALRFSVRERPYIPPTPPSVSEETIDAINDAEPGETVSVALKDGDTTLDAEVFETLAGQDITLEIALEGGVTWTVNGQDIPADANLDDLDLGVEMNSDGIPVDVVNTITGEVGTVQITLAHNGEFGFTMTLTAPLGVENAGYWANLYHYDEDAEALNFEAAAEIVADGSVSLPMSHASQYAIVIDTHSHATVDVSDLFIDIAPDAWYKDAVQYAYDNGLMTGVSATEFAPEATTTRAMIVSILARLENVTTAQAAGFADVDDNDWYATAVNWAANVGVVNGYEDNTFQPNTAITREQLAAILMNYAAYKGEDVSARADLSHYSDADSISSWANDVLLWAVAEGLLTGVTDDTIAPQAHATRAQVAAILQRFLSE